MRYGVDIGGTKMELAAYDDPLNQVWCQRVSIPGEDYAAFLVALKQLVQRADGELGVTGRIGIGLPGVVHSQTRRQLSANVPCLTGRCLADDLEKMLRRPVAIGNDCHCFALAEASTAQTAACWGVFGAVIGTGAGLVIDRRLPRGRNGMVGEWGHLPIPASLVQRYALPLFPCGGGLTGCYERYVSGPGLQHRGHPADSLPALMARYRAGDPHARYLCDLFIDILACALAGLQMVVDANAFVLGGGLSNISEIYPLLLAAMGRWLFPGYAPAPVMPPVYGDDSGVRGAALLSEEGTGRDD